MTNNIKLLGTEPETPPQAPQFPSTHFQITQDGLLISILLAPGISINQGIGEEHMNNICREWLQSRKAIKQQLETIRHIEKSKL